MSALLKVGDLCVGQNHLIDTEYNDMEAVIVGAYGVYSWKHVDGCNGEDLGYMVEWETGETCFATPSHLRLKHPPRSAKSIMREVIAKAKKPCEVPA